MCHRLFFFLVSLWLLIFAAAGRGEGLDWPADRLLPAFSKPADVLDGVDLSDASGAEADLFASLEGIVNRAQPRLISIYQGGEGMFFWFDVHKLSCRMTGLYGAVLKYRTNVTGLVVTDPAQPHTLNLATVIAGVNNELICSPELLATLTNAPYNLAIRDDLRGRFAGKYEVYNELYRKYWRRCTHRIIAGLNPKRHGDLRDYLVAVKGAAFWLDPSDGMNAGYLSQFVSDMKPAHGVFMGWWPSEGGGLEWIAHYGIPVLASDFFRNGTVYGGVTCPIRVPPIPQPPPLENKVYVALLISDGDNVQYMQHTMKQKWDWPGRGSIPIGWTASPLAADLDPAMLDYYWNTATTNDCLVSGPSGAGYAHINEWSSRNLEAYAKISGPYLQRSGLRVVTIWDQVTRTVARAFAKNCPELLGLTDESGKYNKVELGLRTIKLTPAYATSVTNMVASITNAAAKWNGTAPLFIAAQADVWHLGPAELAEVAHALDTNEYQLVRPDQLFLLAKQK